MSGAADQLLWTNSQTSVWCFEFLSALGPERPHQHWQHAFETASDCWMKDSNWWKERGWKWEAERGDERRKEGREGRGGGVAVDATLSELSVMNKPRCLGDKADESECMCKILSSQLPQRILAVPFSWIRRCRVSPLLYICSTPPVYQGCVCVQLPTLHIYCFMHSL